MRTIDIDDEVYGLLDGRAAESQRSHNQTLRILLGLDAEQPEDSRRTNDSPPMIRPGAYGNPERPKKQRKADLWELVDMGYIPEGSVLSLRTAGGIAVEGFDATISGGGLLWNGEHYSMSALARVGLNAVGKMSKDVRGPSHWFTDYGESITDLWERHLQQREEAVA